jgi:NADH dehydrogenase
MPSVPLHVVTGAFGYSGKYIARRLLERDVRVATLTNSPSRPHEFGDRVRVVPLQFTDEDALTTSLASVSVLYNTYWVRFDHSLFNHEAAVAGTLALFRAARRASVGRIVHVSITNPSLTSPLPYFSGKARIEEALVASGVPHSILRPAVLFGAEDILINNIAWALRTFPVFGVFGGGRYRLRPIHVDDLAALAVAEGERKESVVLDAVGPETFTYRELVDTIARAIDRRRPVMSVPRWLGHLVGKIIGAWHRDVFITREEIAGLMAGLLDSQGPATGQTRLSEWAATQKATLGLRYASELRRRRERSAPYSPAGSRSSASIDA